MFINSQLAAAQNDDGTYTITSTDRHGERWDLNADGQPIHTYADLRSFICDLREVRAITKEQESALLQEAAEYAPEVDVHVWVKDLCTSDYLTDHHTRPGELLLGAPVWEGIDVQDVRDWLISDLEDVFPYHRYDHASDYLPLMQAIESGIKRLGIDQPLFDGIDPFDFFPVKLWVVVKSDSIL